MRRAKYSKFYISCHRVSGLPSTSTTEYKAHVYMLVDYWVGISESLISCQPGCQTRTARLG